jgi:hypothetical protein
MKCNEAKWLKDNENGTKRWFGLNKQRTTSTAIKSLFKENGEEDTEDPSDMLEIARKYHAILQSNQPMDESRRSAIEDILRNATKRPNNDESTNLDKDISFNKVSSVIGKAPNGKAPGPNGNPPQILENRNEIDRDRCSTKVETHT